MIDASTAAAPTPVGERIEGLCTWRALLMLGGLLLHGTMGEEDRLVYQAINIVSGSFRMGAFFAISGLLTGFALLRRSDPRRWLRDRLVQLGAPTLFGLLVICPLIRAVVFLQRRQAGIAGPPLSLYHLWFLVALLAYTFLAYAVHRLDARRAIFARIDRRAARERRLLPLVLLTTGATSFVLVGLTVDAIDAWVPIRWLPLVSQLRVAIGSIPLFLLGFAAARAPTFRGRLVASPEMPATIIAVVAATYLFWRSPWMPAVSPATWIWWNAALLTAASAWCAPAATVLILRSAMAIRHVPVAVRRLSDASLTIYLLHYPMIALVKMAAKPLMLASGTTYVLAIVVSGTLSYALHVVVVARSRWLMLLVNGRSECPPMRTSSMGPVERAYTPALP